MSKKYKKLLDKVSGHHYNRKSAVERQTLFKRGLSSAGRASALQAEGHRFEPCRPQQVKILLCRIFANSGGIAQLARAHGSYPWCRGFKSPSRYVL